ncbi:hypothetical protein CHS0354_010895 [Potamilus streckersoni]|uniref:Uncharacterized protein n=1 Tax=Potamilus streckersoni TaxID=2493646 RepID=A0AAE0SPH2_9BIVA|nr:hypothetical protein CHS0354_010895 [Potamilus streckersoni]
MHMHRTCKEKCRGPLIDVPSTEWLKVPNMIEVSDVKVKSRDVEDDNVDHNCMELTAMISDTNREERGLNIGKVCEDGQCSHVVVDSVDEILLGQSAVNQNECCSDQKLDLSKVRKIGEVSRSVTNLYQSYFPCKDLKAGERGSSCHISNYIEPWRHLNLNRNKEHKVHLYVSSASLISRQLMDVSIDNRATDLVKDEMSECSEIKCDVKTNHYVHNYDYEKDNEDFATQIRRTSNENIKMKESVSDDLEKVNEMHHSEIKNDKEAYIPITDICDTEKNVTAIDKCGTPSIDSYMLTLPSETSFVSSSNVGQENHKNSNIRDFQDEVENITNALQE